MLAENPSELHRFYMAESFFTHCEGQQVIPLKLFFCQSFFSKDDPFDCLVSYFLDDLSVQLIFIMTFNFHYSSPLAVIYFCYLENNISKLFPSPPSLLSWSWTDLISLFIHVHRRNDNSCLPSSLPYPCNDYTIYFITIKYLDHTCGAGSWGH